MMQQVTKLSLYEKRSGLGSEGWPFALEFEFSEGWPLSVTIAEQSEYSQLAKAIELVNEAIERGRSK